jgi:hypothetical protein
VRVHPPARLIYSGASGIAGIFFLLALVQLDEANDAREAVETLLANSSLTIAGVLE